MEGVRRNIALKLKPSVKDGGSSKSPSEGSRKKEAVGSAVGSGRDPAPSVEDTAPSPPPPPPPALDHQAPTSPPRPHPLTYQDPPTTEPVTTHTTHTSTTGTASISGKVPPESSVESGGSLQWDHKMNLLGRAVQDPLLHVCEVCLLPVLIYGRMKRCRHAFCRDCAKRAGGVCPRCKEGEQVFEEASMGNVYICSHGGGRYDNHGCGRSYLSQRDLEAHITYRHKDKSAIPPPPPPGSDLTSQGGLTSLPMPPFFTMPGGLPPTFPLQSIPPLPPPNMPGSHMFPARLPQVVFVSQPSTTASGPIPPTWTATSVFKSV